MEVNMKEVLGNFGVDQVNQIAEVDSGLINKSYHIHTSDKDYILQRINKDVFGNAEKIMLNILIAHDQLMKMDGYTIPQVIITKEGQPLYKDLEGYEWRLIAFISNSTTRDLTNDLKIGLEVGSIIGKFHEGTKECDLAKMHVTIPDFHNLDLRIEWFLQSLNQADPDKLSKALDCVQQVESMVSDFEEVKKFNLPLRVTHNDTKLNNILFDKHSKKALCLIDLDTVMPGFIFHDFGDAVRTLCNPVSENDSNLNDIDFNFEMFQQFLNGYISIASDLLTKEEWRVLPISIELMPYIMAVRFLTDYLFDNKYYKVEFPEQNLVRCQNQLVYIEKIRSRRKEIQTSIDQARKAIS